MTIAPGGAGRTKRYVIQKAASTSRTYGPSVSARSRHETLRRLKPEVRGDGIGAFMLHRDAICAAPAGATCGRGKKEKGRRWRPESHAPDAAAGAGEAAAL